MRRLDRPAQQQLIADQRQWHELAPPKPKGTYTAEWNSLIAGAHAVGWTPADITTRGTQALADALKTQGLRNWSQSTITLYAKLLRYAGIEPRRHGPPPPADFTISHVETLWTIEPTPEPTTPRNALAALITWHWPTDLDNLLGLTPNRLNPRRNGHLHITVGLDTLIIPQAAHLWAQLQPHNHHWVFATTKPSGHSNPGAKLSHRGFQKAFRTHCATTGHPDLTWRHLRSIALRQPHAHHIGLGAGTVTATRATNTQPRLARPTTQNAG